MDRRASTASSEDSAVAEKQLHNLETFLGPYNPSPERPSRMARAQDALNSIWERFQPNPAYPKEAQDGSSQAANKPRLRRTAYLDGLKGFAALLVYILHHENWAHPGIDGHSPLENTLGWEHEYYFACFPGLRILFSGGHFAVANFFIISGYVLASKPLSLIHSKEAVPLSNNIGSALFRRWLRLYIPVAATTFIWMTLWHILGIRSSNTYTTAPAGNWIDEIGEWYRDFKGYSFAFGDTKYNVYNDHVWSIPLEFKGSLAVYTSLLAFARSSTNARLLCEGGLVWYFLYVVDGWYAALFMTGVLLCDLDLLAVDGRLPNALRRWSSMPSWLVYLLLVVALWLGGIPAHTTDIMHLRKSPGYYWVSFLTPQAVFDFRWFYLFWGATCLNIAIPRIPSIKSFFETSFCQYLGRICFGLYLVHGPVLWSIGDRMYAATGRIREGHIKLVPNWINIFPFPSWGPVGLEMNFIMPQLILLPITLLVAEAVTKFIDEPSVRFTQWFLKKTLDEDQDVLKRHVTDKKTVG